MELSEQSQPNDEVLYTTTANADQHWYYYWQSHLGSSASYQPQLNGPVYGHWTHPIDHSQSAIPPNPSPTAYSLTVWDPHNRGQANYQYFGCDSVSTSAQLSTGVPMQAINDQSSYRDESSCTSWAPNFAASEHTPTLHRRPSHHSDPGISTNIQGNSISQRSDLRLDTGSNVIATPENDSQGVEQETSPSNTEPSPPAGPSPGSRHRARPVIRCWDHGCDGRRFSSISNYRRHQRERAGQTPVCFCPLCGAVFYRRWTRDHHVERGSCLRIPRWS